MCIYMYMYIYIYIYIIYIYVYIYIYIIYILSPDVLHARLTLTCAYLRYRESCDISKTKASLLCCTVVLASRLLFIKRRNMNEKKQ